MTRVASYALLVALMAAAFATLVVVLPEAPTMTPVDGPAPLDCAGLSVDVCAELAGLVEVER